MNKEEVDYLKFRIGHSSDMQSKYLDNLVEHTKTLESENARLLVIEQNCATLAAAIRKHRGQKGDDRCWMDDQELYRTLGDGDLGDFTCGDKAAMLKNCDRYVNNCVIGGGPWKSYEELLEEKGQLEYTNGFLTEENRLLAEKITVLKSDLSYLDRDFDKLLERNDILEEKLSRWQDKQCE